MHKQKLRIWIVLDELLCAKIRVREGLKCLVGMKQVFISLSVNAVRCVHVREEGTAKRRKTLNTGLLTQNRKISLIRQSSHFIMSEIRKSVILESVLHKHS